MKWRIILVLGCAAVVCGVLLYLLTPYTVAPQPEQLEIHQVRRVGSNTEYIDITAQTDTEALGQLLASCKASRLPSYRSGGYPIDAVRYEIDAVYQNELAAARPLFFRVLHHPCPPGRGAGRGGLPLHYPGGV